MMKRPVLFLAPAVAILAVMLMLTIQDRAEAASILPIPSQVSEIAAPVPEASALPALHIGSETLGSIADMQRPMSVEMSASFITRPTPTPAPVVAAPPATTVTRPPSITNLGPSRLSVPALGINSNWGYYGCGNGAQNALPGGVFVWTCSGANNTYLVSHNTSTFASLRQAYLNGALQPGMTASFSDANGNVSNWRLAWATDMEKTREVYERWSEVGGASAGPVLTMQTCLDGGANGAGSTRFIVVKWVPAG